MIGAETTVSPPVHPPYTPCTPPVQTKRSPGIGATEVKA